MALLSYTLTLLQNAVLHSLGRTPASTTTTTEIVNDAILHFGNAHPWKWRDTAMTLNTTISQSYVALPTDFEQLISLRSGTSTTRAVIPASLDEIMTMRQLNTGIGGYFYYCVSWTTQASVTANPVARLEIYPTPAASETGTFAGKYRRQIVTLSAGSDVPDVPTWCMAALKQMVRAWAVFVEDQQQGTDWELAQQMLDQCKKIDGTTQVLLGMPRGGVGAPQDEELMDDLRFWPNSITA